MASTRVPPSPCGDRAGPARADPLRRAHPGRSAAVRGAADQHLRRLPRDGAPGPRGAAGRGADRRGARPRPGRAPGGAGPELRPARLLLVVGTSAGSRAVGADAGSHQAARPTPRPPSSWPSSPARRSSPTSACGCSTASRSWSSARRGSSASAASCSTAISTGAPSTASSARAESSSPRPTRRSPRSAAAARTPRCSGISRRSPILEVRRRTLDPAGTALEWSCDRYRGDAFEITIHSEHALPRSGVALRAAGRGRSR